jgi:hypothetical protein
MGAQGAGAVDIATPQAKVHAAIEIFRVPARGIGDRGVQRPVKGAVGVGLAMPNLALVQVGVQIDETGPN